MTRTYKIKNVPIVVKQFFDCLYAGPEFTFQFYWYGPKEDKIYGCMVYQNNELYSYANQGTEDDFAKARPTDSLMPYTRFNSHDNPLGLPTV